MKKLALIVCLLLSQASFADNPFSGRLVAIGEVGFGHIDVDEDYRFSEDTKNNQGSITLGALALYKFDFNLVLGSHVSTYYGYSNFGGDDRIHVNDVSVLMGYSFNIAPHFRFVPMVGLSRWKVRSKEGAMFNPGEEEQVGYKGTNPFLRLNFEIPINKRFAINVAYTYGEFDYGDLMAIRAGLKLEFL